MVQPYYTPDITGGLSRGFELGNALRQDVARTRAGAALAGGDYAGGANALLTSGDIANGLRVRDYGAGQEAQAQKAADEKKKALLDYTEEAAKRLAEIHRTTNDPNKTISAFDTYFAPQFRALGEDDNGISELRNGLQSDPETTLMALGVGAAKEAGADVKVVGDEAMVFKNGQLIARYRGARTLNVPEGGAVYDLPGSGGPAAGAGAVDGAGGGFDAFYSRYLAPAEGGYAPNDGNGAPVNFGINQGANPDVNVRDLTPERAKELTYERYLKPSGADQLPPGLAEVQADTAFNMGVDTAKQFLRQSGGDVQKYMQLRERRYRAIAAQNPDKAKFLQTWLERQRQLAQYVSGAGAGSEAPAGPRPLIERPKPREQWVDLPGGGQRSTLTGKTEGVPRTSGRLSAQALAQQNTHLEALNTASAINTRMDKAIGWLDGGKLDLGVAKNVVSGAMNAVGMSNEMSRNYASFRSDLEKLRNDSLRLNKGVQTEGDAQRAWNELFANLNDPKVVRQRLQEIEAYNTQAMAFHEDMVAQIREDSGMGPLDTSKFRAKPLAAPAAPSDVIHYDAQGRRIK